MRGCPLMAVAVLAIVAASWGNDDSPSTSTGAPGTEPTEQIEPATTDDPEPVDTTVPDPDSSDVDSSEPGTGSTGELPAFEPDDRTQGVTDTEIILGSSVPQTGPLAIAGNISAATNACFANVNEGGGVNGRTIQYVVYDDAYAPDQTATNVRRLVESDGVFAVVGAVGTLNGLGVLEYLDGVGVPYVFPVSGSSAWSEPLKERVFGFQPTYTFEGQMFANYFAANSADKPIGVVVQNDDSGEEFLAAFEGAAEAAGLDVVAVESYDRGAESYGPQVLNLQNAGAEVVAMQAIYPAVAGILTESDNLGYNPDYYVANIGFTETLFDVVDPAILEGVHFAGYFPQASDDNPARAEHEQLMAEYAPDIKVDDYTLLGWSICETIVDALERAGEDLEWGSFLAALESTEEFSNGLAPPVNLSPTDHQGVESEKLFVANDGVFVSATELLGADGLPLGS